MRPEFGLVSNHNSGFDPYFGPFGMARCTPWLPFEGARVTRALLRERRATARLARPRRGSGLVRPRRAGVPGVRRFACGPRDLTGPVLRRARAGRDAGPVGASARGGIGRSGGRRHPPLALLPVRFQRETPTTRCRGETRRGSSRSPSGRRLVPSRPPVLESTPASRATTEDSEPSPGSRPPGRP